MSVNFSAGTGLLIAGVFLILLIIPGFTDLLSDLFNRQVRSVWRNSTKYALAVGGVFLISLGLVIILKAEIPESSNQIPLPTKTGVPTFISTPFVCGSGAIPTIGTPEPINPELALVLILIDENTTKKMLEIVMSSLDSSLQIGDRVIFLVSGEQKYENAKIADEVVKSPVALAYPILAPSPTPYPTQTPIPVKTLHSELQKVAVTMTARAAVELATQMSIQHQCNVYEWNSSYQVIYSQWKAENQKLVSQSVELLGQKVLDFTIEKPKNNIMYESLILVSNIFANDCRDDKYEKCVFVPITSMEDSKEQTPTAIQVNFSNIDVVGNIAGCSLYNQECREKATYWENYLSTNNANSVRFVNPDDLWANLVKAIRR